MRRIPRLGQPPAALSQCLHTTVSAPQPRATASRAAATSCLGRPRDFSTTPNRTLNRSRAWPNKAKDELAESKLGARRASTGAKAGTAKVASPRDDVLEPSTDEDPFGTVTAEPIPQTIQTDLILPPTEPTVAPRAGDLEQATEEYTPADTALELEVVGGLQNWFSKKKNHWGASKDFVGFAPSQKVTKPALLELTTMRAVLEAAALAVFAERKQKPSLLADAWADSGRNGVNRVLGLEFKVDEEGQVELGEGILDVAKTLKMDAKAEAEAVVNEDKVTAQEADEMLRTRDQSWKKISLQNPKLKFAVAKRIYQLTGHSIPDAKLLHVKTVDQLLAILVKPPPPRKVIDAIHQRGELTKLPNVEVFAKRRTPVHEAKKVGSWKVIEKELEKRGLPVLGEDKIDGFREDEWFRGPKPAKKDRKKRRH